MLSHVHAELAGCVEQLVEYTIVIMENVPASIVGDCQDLLSSVRHISRFMQEESERRQRQTTMGRPTLIIEEERLSFFVENGFKVRDMAMMLGCSKRTVERRLSTYHLSTHNFSLKIDNDLDVRIKETGNVFPRCGEKMAQSRLLTQGIHVQRQRVRESLCRVDPSGVEARLSNVLQRRIYQIDSPNALWHLDGHHKLIRCRMVVHGEWTVIVG